MFEFLNAHKKTIMFFTLWLVIPSFVLMYGYGQCAAPQQVSWVARVNGIEIDEFEWRNYQDNIRNQMQQQNPDAEIDQETLREQALQTAIVDELFLQTADKWGIDSTDQEVVQSIRQLPYFQDENGNFNIVAYRALLNQSGLSPVQFEQMQRKQLTQNKVRNVLRSALFRASSEERASADKEAVNTDFELLAFEPANYTDQVDIDAAALDAFFQENIEDYRVPEKRKISYVYFAASDYINEATFTDFQLERYFNQNIRAYEIPQKVRVEYITYDAQKFADQAQASDDEIAEYFSDNRNQYTTDDRVRFRYAVQPLAALAELQNVTDGAVEAYYNQNISRYQHDEQAKASHILIRVEEGADPEEAKARIEEIREEIVSGDISFGEAAEQYSEGPSAPQQGDLGYFGRGQMVPPFEEAVFSLPLGQVSEPVLTRFGYHLIQVEDRKEAGTDPLEDVRDEIVDTLRSQRAVSAFREYENTLESLDELEGDFEIKTTGWLARGAEIPGVPQQDSYYLISAAFRSTEDGPVKFAGTTRTENIYLVETLEREQSRPQTLDEAREAVLEDLKRVKAEDIAQQAAEADMARIRDASVALDAIAAERDLRLNVSQPFGRSDSFIPGLGARPFSLVNAAFTSEQGQVSGPFTTQTGTHIIRLLAREPARLPELDEVRRQVETDYMQDQAGRLARFAANELADSLFDADGLASAADAKGLTVQETELFAQDEAIPGIGMKPELARTVFNMDEVGDETYIPVEDRQSPRTPQQQQQQQPLAGLYVCELLEIQADYLPELDEVRDEVETAFKLKEAEDIAITRAEQKLTDIRQAAATGSPVSATRTVDLEAFVSDEDLAGGVYRGPLNITGNGQVPGIGRSPVIVKTLKAMEPGQISQVVKNYSSQMKDGERVQGPLTGAYILQLLDMTTDDEAEPSPFEQFLAQRQQMSAASAWLSEVSAQAEIEYNEQLLNPSLAEGDSFEGEEGVPAEEEAAS